MQCQHESYFDDMYPEFAPEPIVVRCEARATHHWTTIEDAADPESGYPMRGVREVVHTWACDEHAPLWSPDENGWNMYQSRVIRTEVVQ